jgi:hypothetical protein
MCSSGTSFLQSANGQLLARLFSHEDFPSIEQLKKEEQRPHVNEPYVKPPMLKRILAWFKG